MPAPRVSTRVKRTPARLDDGDDCIIISPRKSQATKLRNKKPSVKSQPAKTTAPQKAVESNETFVWKAKLMTIDDAQYIASILGIEPESENSSKPAKDLITGRTTSCTASGHAESDGGNDSDSKSEPASESLLLKRITTTITVSQG